MEYRWIEHIQEFRDIAEEWDRALIDSGGYNPFLLSDFIRTWWQHFHEGRKLRIFVATSDGRVVGGIPLSLKRGNAGYGFARILSYVGGAAANYTEPLYVSGDTQLLPLLEGALAARGDWDALYLSDVRDQSRLLSEHRNCPPCKKLKRVLAQDHMDWAIDLSEGEEKYLKGLSGKLKRDLRAKRQRLEKEYGPLALKEIKGAEAVARHFDLYTQFSLRAFTTRGRRSAFEDERYAAFYKDFLIRMDAKGRLDAHALSAGDRLLALSFGYRFGKGFNWVLTGFNYDYKYFRPGYLLIEELLKEIVRRGETYYNWYSHERFYKAQWCNRRSPLYRFSLFRRTLKGACYGMLRNAERALRSNRAVVSLVRRVRRS